MARRPRPPKVLTRNLPRAFSQAARQKIPAESKEAIGEWARLLRRNAQAELAASPGRLVKTSPYSTGRDKRPGVSVEVSGRNVLELRGGAAFAAEYGRKLHHIFGRAVGLGEDNTGGFWPVRVEIDDTSGYVIGATWSSMGRRMTEAIADAGLDALDASMDANGIPRSLTDSLGV